MWLRYANIRTIWKCLTTRGYTTKYHAVGVAIRDEYEKKPIEDIDVWAKRLGDFVVNKMCENSCQSLSTSVFCDKASLNVEIVYTSETLVVVPPIVKPPEIIPPVVVPEVRVVVPADVLASINRLEARKKRVSPEISAVIQIEIDLLKKRYGIK